MWWDVVRHLDVCGTPPVTERHPSCEVANVTLRPNRRRVLTALPLQRYHRLGRKGQPASACRVLRDDLMPKIGKGRLPDADAWKPTLLRLVAFPVQSPVELDQQWFRELTGAEPPESVKRPTERVDQGIYGEVALNLSVDLLRVVLTVSPQIDTTTPPEQFPTLGPLQLAFTSFSKLATKWLAGKHPPIKRLSFVGTLAQFTKNQRLGYRLLGNYLPDVKIDAHSGDFLYRINRRRPSKVWPRVLEINRLSTWTVRRAAIRAHTRLATGETSPAVTVADSVVCCLDFDVNTMPEFTGKIPQNKLVRIFRELGTLATEIAARGDVR